MQTGMQSTARRLPCSQGVSVRRMRPSLPRLVVRTAQRDVSVLEAVPNTSTGTPPNSPTTTPSLSTSSALDNNTAYTSSSSPSACPFLASLPVPPKAIAPWNKKLLQFTNPAKWQEAAVAGRDVVEGTFLLQPAVLSCTAEHAKTVLTGEGDYTTIGWPDYFAQLFGPGALILYSGQRHRLLRTLMQPAFTAEALAGFVPQIVDITERYLSSWAAAPGAVAGQEQLKLLTFEIILQVVLGQTYTSEEMLELNNLFKAWLGGLFTLLPYDLPFLPYGAAMRAREQLGVKIQAAITAARAQAAAGQPPSGILGNLVTARDDQGNSLTDEEIESNVIVMLFAGHDTSSATLALALAQLTDNPRVMQRLREEQEQVVAAHGSSLDATALRSMPYAEAVIRETLRLDPVVAGVLRKASTDFELGGYRVPQNTSLLVPLSYVGNHDPRWTAPEGMPAEAAAQHSWGSWPRAEFNPDLLLTEEGQKQGWLMPFGAGNRYCIGAPLALLEMKIFLAVLARGYKAAADTNTEWGTIPMPQPKNGLPLTVARLQPAA